MAVTDLRGSYVGMAGGNARYLLEWTNDIAYDDVTAYVSNWSGLGWSAYHIAAGDATKYVCPAGADSHTISDFYDEKIKIKLLCFKAGVGSFESNEAIVCAITLTDTTTWSSSPTYSIACSNAQTDTLTWSHVQTCGINFYVTGTDTITWSSEQRFAVSVKTDFAFYLGDNTGDVHTYDGTLYSDNGAAITSQWRSRRLDFVDQLPQLIDRQKCIRKAIVLYDDISANSMITLYVSMDGGVTWSTQTKTVGTGDGTTKQATFHFIKTGYVADVMIETASTDKRFKWHQLVIDVDDAGVNI